MKKLVLLAVLAVLAMPLFAATENFDFGADMEFRGISLFRDQLPDDHFAEAEVYLWASADLADNVMAKINFQYRNEFGGSGPAFVDNDTNGEIDLEEAFLKIGRPWDYPVSAVIGRFKLEKPNELGCEPHTMNRANVIPVYGEGFILNNNGPVDGARVTLDLEPAWIDFLWFKLEENVLNSNDDNSLYGIYGQAKVFEVHQVEAYALFVDDQGVGPGTSETGIFGARAEGSTLPIAGLGYKAEVAYTHTHITGPGDEPDGFGGLVGVDYTLADIPYCPSARFNFYYMEPNFTQPFGHVDQDDIGEVGYGRILDFDSNLSNAPRGVYFFNVGGSVKISDQFAIDADYFKYNNQWGNAHLGHEIDLRLSYQYSENVAAELIGSYFIAPENPGGAAAANFLGFPDDAYLLKGGVKVSF